MPAVTTSYGYAAATGRLLAVNGVNADGLDVQDPGYQWDTLGNLVSREDQSGTKSVLETFGYDGLNRLSS